MLITIVNEAEGSLENAEVLEVIRAISRQIIYDFEPYWNLSARLRLAVNKKPLARPPSSIREPSNHPEDLTNRCPGALIQMDPVAGGALIILQKWTSRDERYRELPYSYGFHDMFESLQFPVGYVFVTDDNGGPRGDWTVTLSHEILELIANPYVNTLVEAPHPDPGWRAAGRRVFVEREVCDPVKDSFYELDHVKVSNFVLPLYFLRGGDANERVDFIGEVDGFNQPLGSFGMMPGGYVPIFDPAAVPPENPRKLVHRNYPGVPGPEYYEGVHPGVPVHWKHSPQPDPAAVRSGPATSPDPVRKPIKSGRRSVASRPGVEEDRPGEGPDGRGISR